MTRDEIVTWIREICGFRTDTDRDDVIRTHIVHAQQWLERMVDLPADFRKLYTFSTTGDEFDLPSDFLRRDGDILVVGTTMYHFRELVEFDKCEGSEVWTIKSSVAAGSGPGTPDKIALGIEDSSGLDKKFFYWCKADDLSTASTNWWTQQFPYLIGAMAGRMYAMTIEDQNAVQQFERIEGEQKAAFTVYAVRTEIEDVQLGGS